MEVTFSGEKAICPDCKSVVIGRKGEFKVKHWYHKTKQDCNTWSEPITQWHIDWQNIFPKEFREVSITDQITQKSHRADIRLKNGLVIEIQNSPIKSFDILAREKFYGNKNMIWILNGKVLAEHSELRYVFEKKKIQLYITIPSYFERLPEYNMDIFREKMQEYSIFSELGKVNGLVDCVISNGHCFKYLFDKPRKFKALKFELESMFREMAMSLYGYEGYKMLQEELTVDFVNIPRDTYSNIYLEQKYWRSFIYLMEFPVFYDNLYGLEKDLLFWYQKNKLVKKSDFIDKYLNYT